MIKLRLTSKQRKIEEIEINETQHKILKKKSFTVKYSK